MSENAKKQSDLLAKPRGYYKMQEKWTKDKTKDYFEGNMNSIVWPIVKITAILCLGYLLQSSFGRLWLSMVTCLLITNYYPLLVSKVVPNTIKMPAMDHQCFISTPGVYVNYMNCTMYDEWNDEAFKSIWDDVFSFMPKFRYKIKEIAGDYYYESMPLEELKDKIFVQPESEDRVLRSQDDINQFIADNLNQKMPMDGPQVRLYMQKYDPIDMDHIEKDKRPKGIMIWKCHHSFCDGVSAASLLLAMSNKFDRSFFLASKDAPWYVRLLARVMAPFQIPMIAIKQALASPDVNFFTKKKSQPLSGIMNCSSSYHDIDLKKVKDLSKYKGVTVNDLVMCSLTTALATVFAEQGEMVDKIKIALPANLRFKFYKSRYHVKMENKFACLPIEVPLSRTMEESYGKIHKATKTLKNSAGITYAMYAMAYWCNKLLPRAFSQKACTDLSNQFTIALSNVPGAIKPYVYEDKKSGHKQEVVSSRSYIMVAGNMGMAMCVFSQIGKFYSSFCTDDSICDKQTNKRIMDLTTSQILEEIEKMQIERQKDQSGGSSVTTEANSEKLASENGHQSSTKTEKKKDS